MTRTLETRRMLSGNALFGLLVLLAWTVGARVASAESVDEAMTVQDILFCGPRRPFLIRLHLSVNGKGFRSLREEWADAQFAALDTDKNGLLEGDELKRLPAPELLRAGLSIESTKVLKADTDPADGKVSPAESRRYLLAATGTPFSLLPQANNGVQVNLFPKLDGNQDGKLSGEEIAEAEARLRRYDRNEDDLVTVQELAQSLAEEQAVAQQQLAGVLRLLIVVDPNDHVLTSRRLLETFDKASRDPVAKTFRKDERLSQAELSIEAGEFDRADANRDGKLDRLELGRLSAVMTPSVEMSIEAPSVTGAFLVKSMRPVDETHAKTIKVKQEAGGPWLLVLNDAAFALTAAGPDAGVEPQLRTNFQQLFKQMDQDNNDYLEPMELQRFGFSESFFLQADADSDKKLFEKEYQGQIEREIELSKASFALEIAGDGRSLFRLIDTAPADGRLTLRELADAPAKLLQWDSNGDGDMTLTELSIALNAVFRAGTPRVSGPNFGRRPATGLPANLTAVEAPAPSWFSKMDRNRDGDLSPKEFLGRRALFDKIDQNLDGLISADEAMTAHRDAIAEPQP